MQCTSTVLMVRPASFGFNEQTAINNYFQRREEHPASLQYKAQKEFDMLVKLLRSNRIEVIVIDDTPDPVKPDAIFPNNWFSCYQNTITLFPMYAPNRRTEKRKDIVNKLKEKTGFSILNDMSNYESNSMFLEGTGSMVCDHQNKIIYACLSQRTNEQLLKEYAAFSGYTTHVFSAADKKGQEIYHTNVMMCIGERFAIFCADVVTKDPERNAVIKELEKNGHQVIFISEDQMCSFAGNMLQLNNNEGVPFLLMSKTASGILKGWQIKELEKYITPLVADVTSIEKAGGGSVRCMVAEIFY